MGSLSGLITYIASSVLLVGLVLLFCVLGFVEGPAFFGAAAATAFVTSRYIGITRKYLKAWKAR